ncbi:hypothetical protein L3V43_22055 [Pseudoalteromonas sp. L23]|uniref:hypothetical protein n=1 Tax=unclassified Pseudoalteromonas TaxID=194690 RepID=UPI001EEF8620|nr:MULTISPECIES: hypothetical protein [unclassified Pseudoalteromonas]MCF7516313.1 hypothetical protein [Pseudoalteromonas sp. L7]MCF7528339.1 hypothetical protein [Pseudoalteromonas sp. L23]
MDTLKKTIYKNSINNKVKYEKHSYKHATELWELGKLQKHEVSNDDSKYTTVKEISYYDNDGGNNAYTEKNLPYEIKIFGEWRERFIEYNDVGGELYIKS